MIRLLKSLTHRLIRALCPPAEPVDPADPFSHPEIRAMSRRDLADLPFPRARG